MRRLKKVKMGLTRLLGEQDEYISVQLEGAGGEAINDDEI